MHLATLRSCAISSWVMALVYNKIEVDTGVEFKMLLYAAIIMLAIGLYVGCRENKGTTKEES